MKKISVIIPTFNNPEIAIKTIQAVLTQTYPPQEIIIIDSSDSDGIKAYALQLETFIDINYQRLQRLYPGEARNLGATLAQYEYLAFLDSKTIPNKNWLQINTTYLANQNVDVVFGTTKYLANTNYQKALQASTHGKNAVETTPGSVISKHNFMLSAGFVENIRTGDDLYWRQRLKLNNFLTITPNETTLTYSELEPNILNSFWRFATYQLYTSKLMIQENPKKIYLFSFLLLLAILTPQWNQIVGGYLYIPYITTIYFFTYFLASFFIFVIDRYMIQFLFFQIKQLFTLIFFAHLFVVIFFWNDGVARWIESSPLYFPHITKLYIFTLAFLSFAYRGIYFPLKQGFTIKELFPFWWIYPGCVGLVLDIAKAPGYLLGGVISILRKR